MSIMISQIGSTNFPLLLLMNQINFWRRVLCRIDFDQLKDYVQSETLLCVLCLNRLRRSKLYYPPFINFLYTQNCMALWLQQKAVLKRNEINVNICSYISQILIKQINQGHFLTFSNENNQKYQFWNRIIRYEKNVVHYICYILISFTSYCMEV